MADNKASKITTIEELVAQDEKFKVSHSLIQTKEADYLGYTQSANKDKSVSVESFARLDGTFSFSNIRDFLKKLKASLNYVDDSLSIDMNAHIGYDRFKLRSFNQAWGLLASHGLVYSRLK